MAGAGSDLEANSMVCKPGRVPAYQQLKARGVEFLRPPADQPWGLRTSYFADPDGNFWEINSPV